MASKNGNFSEVHRRGCDDLAPLQNKQRRAAKIRLHHFCYQSALLLTEAFPKTLLSLPPLPTQYLSSYSASCFESASLRRSARPRRHIAAYVVEECSDDYVKP